MQPAAPAWGRGRGAAPRSCTAAILAAVLAGVCAALSGCATTESDMPWNSPQSWEGSPYLPGLTDRY